MTGIGDRNCAGDSVGIRPRSFKFRRNRLPRRAVRGLVHYPDTGLLCADWSVALATGAQGPEQKKHRNPEGEKSFHEVFSTFRAAWQWGGGELLRATDRSLESFIPRVSSIGQCCPTAKTRADRSRRGAAGSRPCSGRPGSRRSSSWRERTYCPRCRVRRDPVVSGNRR